MADPDNIEERLKRLLVERLFLKIAPAAMSSSAPLLEAFGLDSVQLLEFVVGIEDEFQISLEGTDFSLSSFRTLADVAGFVRGRLGA